MTAFRTNWPEVELGEVCDFAYGKSLPAKARSGSGFPVFGSNGQVGLHEEALTDGETIIIGRKGSFGEVHYSKESCSPIDTTYYITKHQTEAYLPWLARRLRYLGLDQLNRAAAIPGLNRADAYRQRLLLPPLGEQKRIAAILDAADALRTKRRESLDQLNTLLQSTFLDMFGDPVTNPKGWETQQLPELVSDENHSLKRGPFGGALKKEIFVPEGFKVYEQKHVIYNDFEIGEYFINEIDYARLDAFKVKANDLLVSCSGTIGRIAKVPEGATLGVMNQALLKIRLKASRMLNHFFLNLWRSQPFERQVLGMTHGTGMKNMKSMQELKSINFITPPLSLQSQFAVIVGSVEQQKTRLRDHLAELDILFASLQQRAFNGEL